MFCPDEYPANLVEFNDWFNSDQACREYLEIIRWPKGFQCPRCGTSRHWVIGKRGVKECAGCHHQTSVIAGTVFDGTRKPLRLWFLAMWLITSEKNGISAMGLQRQLGFSRYETAWTWLHKLRHAMVRPGRDRLSGLVEVDETYVGGEAEGLRGRGSAKKSIVVIAVEEKEYGIGRVRLRRRDDASHASLAGFIQDVVTIGSTIRTDGWSGYKGLEKLGYEHDAKILRAYPDTEHLNISLRIDGSLSPIFPLHGGVKHVEETESSRLVSSGGVVGADGPLVAEVSREP
jgi:transposase-like protein